MKTKALLAAAVLAAGLATSMADTYSQNVVGFVNQVCNANGFTMICNPLNTTNNTVLAILQNPRNGMIAYKWNGSFAGNSYAGAWASPSATMNPGEGVFLYVPAGNNYTNTYVGEVLQGDLTNSLLAGFNMVGSKVPQAGGLQTDLGYPVSNGSLVYKWTTTFASYSYAGSWAPSEPQLQVAEGFFAYKPAAVNWVRSFTVQ
jgi:hypothetical protein